MWLHRCLGDCFEAAGGGDLKFFERLDDDEQLVAPWSSVWTRKVYDRISKREESGADVGSKFNISLRAESP